MAHFLHCGQWWLLSTATNTNTIFNKLNKSWKWLFNQSHQSICKKHLQGWYCAMVTGLSTVLTTPSCALFGLLTLSSPGAMGAFPSVHTYTEQWPFQWRATRSAGTEKGISPRKSENQWAYIQSPAQLYCLYRAIHLLIRISLKAERKLQDSSVLLVSVSEGL